MKSIKTILGNTRRPDISFSSNGRIEISSHIVKSLDMRKGDIIDIMTGGEEYYLYISCRAPDVFGRHEAQCYPTQKGSRHFRAYCRRLCSAILTASPGSTTVCFAAGEVTEINGHKAIPIITRKNLTHEQRN